MRFIKALMILVILVVGLYGCGGGGAGSTGTPAGNTELKVTSINPVNGAITVARDGSITVTFNENIAASTVNNLTMTVIR